MEREQQSANIGDDTRKVQSERKTVHLQPFSIYEMFGNKNWFSLEPPSLFQK